MTVKYIQTIYADDKTKFQEGWREGSSGGTHDFHKGEQSLCLVSTRPNSLVSVCPNLTKHPKLQESRKTLWHIVSMWRVRLATGCRNESGRGDGGEKREGGTQKEKSAQKNGASAYCRGA